jgi:uncharacterized membrane protein YedE/YeeE
MYLLLSLISGLIFGLGLIISGMTQPAKVIGFLDITGNWQIDLMGVMGGALMVHALLRLLILKRSAPLFANAFPSFKSELDLKLVVGAVLFGLGWGMAGFCPGPALTSVGAVISGFFQGNTSTEAQSGLLTVIYFVLAMSVGTSIAKQLQKRNILS